MTKAAAGAGAIKPEPGVWPPLKLRLLAAAWATPVRAALAGALAKVARLAVLACAALALTLALPTLMFAPGHSGTAAAQDVEAMAQAIADSLKAGLDGTRYKTVGISRIRQKGAAFNITELIDFTNVKIVRGRSFRVIDRSKLELILKEQQVQLSDVVSAQKYQELGSLLGVDLFIYGTFYRDALVLKGIDVENSAIAWADIFPTRADGTETQDLVRLGEGLVESLEKDADRLRKARISLVSFWDLDVGNEFTPELVMDHLSVALTRNGRFKVVDRENLELIVKEQRLTQSTFIDQGSAKRLGELYGVDAFIYGGITKRPDGSYLASLKMLNIFNGVIEWADLVKIEPGGTLVAAAPGAPQTAAPVGAVPRGMVSVPGGIFLMGANEGFESAMPLHQVQVATYYIDETEVSNGEYARFVEQRHYRPPVGWPGNTYPPGKGDDPVVGVSWVDAQQYCLFAKKRLPTEAEWEKAHRGTAGQRYAWSGEMFSPGFVNTRESGRKSAVSVSEGLKDISPYGVKNMAGNVREWTGSAFVSYRGAAQPCRRGANTPCVVRGGSWNTDRTTTLSYFRDGSNPNLAWQDLGIRCAMSP